jgi:uncharacterized membrane protein
MKLFIRYFIRGLLFLFPIVITIYLIVSLVKILDRIVPTLFEIELQPGVGIAIVLSFIFLTGLFTTIFIVKPVFSILENYIYKIPFINIIYSSSKDVAGAILGEKKKFDHPVLVRVSENSTMQRIGFVTRESFELAELKDKVAVYFPHSYNISGNIFIVDKSAVQEIRISGSDAMKFIVSAGVTGELNEKKQ